MTNLNKDNPKRWKEDIACSVDFYNQWFMEFAPKAYLETRSGITAKVEETFRVTKNLKQMTAEIIKKNPSLLATLRMVTCPPLARDRLMNLANTIPNLVKCLENGKLPTRMKETELNEHLHRIIGIIERFFDPTKLNTFFFSAAILTPVISDMKRQRELIGFGNTVWKI